MDEDLFSAIRDMLFYLNVLLLIQKISVAGFVCGKNQTFVVLRSYVDLGFDRRIRSLLSVK